MGNEKLTIDLDRLRDDIFKMKKYFSKSPRADDIRNDYYNFLTLVMMYENITGEEIDTSNIFINPKKAKKILSYENERDNVRFRELLEEYFSDIASVLLQFYVRSDGKNIMDMPFYSVMRKYSKKDFTDIVLEYFSKYGLREEKIIKKYFAENRIQNGVYMDGGLGYLVNCVMNKSGYIVTSYKELDSFCQSIIVHELGHAIDDEVFAFPQYKKLGKCDVLTEVPSTFFEIGFAFFLKDQNIDRDGSIIILNDIIRRVMETAEGVKLIINEQVKNGRVVLEDGGYVVIDDETLSLIDIITYGLSYYISFYLQCMLDGDYKGFMKRFYNFLTTRGELSLEEGIETLGINYDDFMMGDVIIPKVKENTIELKKRFK